MRATNYFSVCLLLLVFTQQLWAQQDHEDKYWGPDTTRLAPEFQTYNQIIDYLYGNLNSELTTDILVDRTPDISNKDWFDGSRQDAVGNADEFYTLYTEMNSSLIDTSKHVSMLIIDSSARADFIDGDVLSIGLLRYEYNEINPEAKAAGKVRWNGYQCEVAKSANPVDPFLEKEVALLAPLIPAQLSEGELTVLLDYPYIFSNVSYMPMQVEIDFDDGRGYQEVIIGEPLTIHYPHDGLKEWRYRLIYEDGFELTGLSSVRSKDSDPVLEYGCGEGTTITKGQTFRDLPDKVQPIAAEAAIENKKNELEDVVSGELGIYYGCGNTSCAIRKPFILVSGFGPDISVVDDLYVTKQKRIKDALAKNTLYNHMNGAYGVAGLNNEPKGANNGANILYKLRNEGYDVIILYFDNGVDYVQNHAELVIRTIEYVNQQKAQNGSTFENILLGQSMGGISTRYALAKWEKDRMQENSDPYQHHHTKLWISWEGEMQGATIPLGLQFTTWFLTRRIGPAVALAIFNFIPQPGGAIVSSAAARLSYFKLFDGLLNNPAAKSMLTYHWNENRHESNKQLIKDPLHEGLLSNLDYLGYPSCRRVGIANGSSTVEFAEQMPNGTSDPNYESKCLVTALSLELGNGIKCGYGANTEEVGDDVTVFHAGLAVLGLGAATLNINQRKEYSKAESILPGATERFTDMMRFSDWTCNKNDYKAPFVPTTSALDIQTDESDDFSYEVSKNLFYREYGQHDPMDLFGYPHNNPSISNPEMITPFDACYASSKNEFHLQNPSHEIADFIIQETVGSSTLIQNRSFAGHANTVYEVQFEAREEIETGSAITETAVEGDCVFDESSIALLEAQRVRFSSGTHMKHGSKVHAISYDQDPMAKACFSFSESNFKTTGDSGQGGHFEEATNDQVEAFEEDVRWNDVSVFPNPFREQFTLKVSEALVGSRYIVLDPSGRILAQGNIHSEHTTLSADGYPQVGILSIQNGNHIITKKIIKQ